MSLEYLARRATFTIVSLVAAVTLVFLMIHLVPGDPVATILGDMYNPEAAHNLRQQLGLNLPLWRQYTHFLGDLFTGNLGASFITKQAVLPTVLSGFVHTLRLAALAMLVSGGLGLVLGITAALNRGGPLDAISMTIAVLGVSMPSFWLGILLMILFSVRLGWLPMIGAGEPGNVGDILLHLVLPALTLGLRGAGLTARVTRSAILEMIHQDHVRTARSKGMRERRVNARHVMRNAMLPISTIIGLDVGRLLGGTTVVETVFGRPGTGTLLIKAVLARDYPTIQAAFLLYLTVIIVVNFLVDIAYANLDPRVTYR